MYAIALSALIVRRHADPDSDVVGATLPAGTRLRIMNSEDFNGKHRLKVAIEGDSEPLGWISRFSNKGIELVSVENIKGLRPDLEDLEA